MIPRFKTEQNLSPSLCSLASEILRGVAMEERKKKEQFLWAAVWGEGQDIVYKNRTSV